MFSTAKVTRAIDHQQTPGQGMTGAYWAFVATGPLKAGPFHLHDQLRQLQSNVATVREVDSTACHHVCSIGFGHAKDQWRDEMLTQPSGHQDSFDIHRSST